MLSTTVSRGPAQRSKISHASTIDRPRSLRRKTALDGFGRFGCATTILILALTAACRSGIAEAPLDRDESQAHPGPAQAQLVSPHAPAQPPVEPVEPAAPVQNPLETIATLEDARSDGGGLLQVLLAKGQEPTRRRAAIALGRLPYPEQGEDVTAALCAALKDEAPLVRSAAAFALGERADPDAASALLEHMDDPVPEVRARLVEAASRIDHPALRNAVLRALKDRAPEVRAEAALGPYRWPVKPMAPVAGDAAHAEPKPSAEDRSIDLALIDAVHNETSIADDRARDAAGDGAQREIESGPQLRAQARVVTKPALFSLMRRKCAGARAVFHAHLTDKSDPETRIFAVQGLAALPNNLDSTRALCETLVNDTDWRVQCEAALALGKHPDPMAVAALTARVDHKSSHVRRCVYDALGNMELPADLQRSLFEHARLDPSPEVRAVALESESEQVKDALAPYLESQIGSKDPLTRAAVAAAAKHLSDGLAVPMLVRLSKDPSLRVADIATHGLENHPTEEARARLRELLVGADNGLRLAAVEALRKQANAQDLPLLKQSYQSAHGEISSELSSGILDSAAAIGGPDALDLLKSGLAHPDPFVRKRARELIAQHYPDASIPRVDAPKRKPALVPPEDVAFTSSHPRVEIRTSKGSMIFELYPDETPVHVVSFLELVKQHHYDGLPFHRVVPDFVIQGGDVRGDGNGGASWRGDALRAEFTPRKFVRGALGMPRNEDPDSGGSQIFVTHRWTPHLDGRYTLFGGIVSGGEVLDAIEVGDTILEAKVLPPAH